MASITSKPPVASTASHLLDILGKLLHSLHAGARSDDPVCLSALDETTLARFGYSETQIRLMKEGTLR